MSAEIKTKPPVVGVLCMDKAREMSEKTHSYISVKYVKYLELLGAKVVPIWINKSRDYYEKMLNLVNGVLIPGGAVHVNKKDEVLPTLTNYCVQSVEHILAIGIRKCDEGKEIPIWGICLGFQLLVLLTSDILDVTEEGCDPREECVYMRCRLPVKFCSDLRSSRLFKKLSADLEKIMQEAPFGQHRHRFCITFENLKNWKFKSSIVWQPLAKNSDSEGRKFVSIIECSNYPFFGTQIHPESILFDESDVDSIEKDVNSDCIKVVKYLAEFFLQECSKNVNSFGSETELGRHLIQNFEYAKVKKCYEFEESCDYPEVVANE